MRAAALLLGAVTALAVGGCQRRAAVPAAAPPPTAAPAAAVAPASAPTAAPATAAAPASRGAPASTAAAASAPASLPDVYAAAPAPGSVITDPQGRRYPVNQMVVTVAPGTSREAVDEIAAAVRGRVVGQIPSDNLYQIVVPTTTADELEVALARLRRDPRVKAATQNFMRGPAPRR